MTSSNLLFAVFNETCRLSENIYENIINGYSENKFLSNSMPNQTTKPNNNLIPGLSSKPPLPPFTAEPKHQTIEECSSEEKPKNKEATNIKTIAEQEAFDEIIALKFQRWFPNTSSVIHEESSSGDDNEMEMLSYKQRQQYQTCEYRCEIFKKNKKILTFDDESNMKGVKSNRPKIKTPKASKSQKCEEVPEAKEPENDAQPNIDSTDMPISEVMPHKVDDLDALQALEERDMQILRERQNSKMEKLESEDKLRQRKSVEKPFELKNKNPKTNLQKKTSSSSPINGPLKKQKKISFSMSRRGSAEIRPKKSVEFPEPHRGDNWNEDFGKESSKSVEEMENETEQLTDALRQSANSPQLPAGSQIEDVLSWMGTHRSATPRSKMVNNSEYRIRNFKGI